MVLWLIGLSGSGKTTLANALKERLGPRFAGLVVLDGDQVRAAFGDGLGHAPEDRVVQVTRVQRLARLLSDQGLVVIVALVYQNPALLSWNRDQIQNYYEVHIDCSLETREAGRR
jgi:adenylylsulfate kinase-like enzyme